jgi:alanine racemase
LKIVDGGKLTDKRAKVVVMGRQGKDEITAHDLGRWTNTFAYEIMTRMGKRLPVVYKQR